jgi:hypothetical protein
MVSFFRTEKAPRIRSPVRSKPNARVTSLNVASSKPSRSRRPDPVKDPLDLGLVPGFAATSGVALGVEVGEQAPGGLELEHAGDQVAVGLAGPAAVGESGGPGAPGTGLVGQVAALGQRGAELVGGGRDDLGRAGSATVTVAGSSPWRYGRCFGQAIRTKTKFSKTVLSISWN